MNYDDLPPRPDAKPDEDGDCCVCGLLWEDEKETPHVCPPGFLIDTPDRSVPK